MRAISSAQACGVVSRNARCVIRYPDRSALLIGKPKR